MMMSGMYFMGIHHELTDKEPHCTACNHVRSIMLAGAKAGQPHRTLSPYATHDTRLRFRYSCAIT